MYVRRTERQSKRQLLGTVREHMNVVGSDEEHLGTVDKVRGDQIVLTKSDSSDQHHHTIPCSLVDRIESVARWMLGNEVSPEDRLAGSYPLTTMLSVATGGWLLARQAKAAAGGTPFEQMKRTVARFFLDRIVPEAGGLEASAKAGADALYAVNAETLAA